MLRGLSLFLWLGLSLALILLASHAGEMARPLRRPMSIPRSHMMPLVPIRPLVSDVLSLHMDVASREGNEEQVYADMKLLFALYPDQDVYRSYLGYWMAMALTRSEGREGLRRRWIERAFGLLREGLSLRPMSATLHHGYGTLVFLKATAEGEGFQAWLRDEVGGDPFWVAHRHLDKAARIDPTQVEYRHFAFECGFICGNRALEAHDAEEAMAFYREARSWCRPSHRQSISLFVELAQLLHREDLVQARQVYRELRDESQEFRVPDLGGWLGPIKD